MPEVSPVEIVDNRSDHSKPIPEYEPFQTIMDRVAVRRVVVETAPDGFVVPDKYRQHTNVGVVVKVGQFVILGGKQIPIGDVIKEGDRVHFGEYNAEKFKYGEEDLELVRIQDIRGVERRKNG